MRIENSDDYTRDDAGKFAEEPGSDGEESKPAVEGKGGDAPAPPKRITVAEADARLSKGEKVKSVDGKDVNFGERLLYHLNDGKDVNDANERKECLDWGKEAVRSGKHVVDSSRGEERDLYAKIFHENEKDKGVLVVVDSKDGEAFSMYRQSTKGLKKKGLINRCGPKGLRHEKQLSPEVLHSIVAADAGEDWGSQ